jgi:hypothetical protein
MHRVEPRIGTHLYNFQNLANIGNMRRAHDLSNQSPRHPGACHSTRNSLLSGSIIIPHWLNIVKRSRGHRVPCGISLGCRERHALNILSGCADLSQPIPTAVFQISGLKFTSENVTDENRGQGFLFSDELPPHDLRFI